jgi:hypothetical protein
MHVSILTNPRSRSIAETHANRLASKHGAHVETLYLDSDGTSNDRVDAMCEEWSVLRSSSGPATRFNDPVRVVRRIVFTARPENSGPNTTYVILARQDDAIVVFISDIHKGPTITRMEVPQTGILVGRGHRVSEMCSEIVQTALSRGVADQVHVRNLRVDHPVFDRLKQWRSLGARGSSEPKIRWWATLLNSDTGERVDKHSGKTRANLRKLDRRFVGAFDGEAELELVTRPEQVDGFVNDAVGIIRETYQASLGIGVQDTEAYRALLREMAETGALRGYVMRGKGSPIAYVVGDRWGTAFTLWATSFLPEFRKLAPGIVTLRRVMDSLATEGVAEFDFGWGDAEYKKKLGDHHTNEEDIVLYAKRPLPTLAFMAGRTKRAAKARTDQFMATHGLRDRLKRIWRKKLVGSAS